MFPRTVPGDPHAQVSTCSQGQRERGGSDLCCVVKSDELYGGEGAQCGAGLNEL